MMPEAWKAFAGALTGVFLDRFYNALVLDDEDNILHHAHWGILAAMLDKPLNLDGFGWGLSGTLVGGELFHNPPLRNDRDAWLLLFLELGIWGIIAYP